MTLSIPSQSTTMIIRFVASSLCLACVGIMCLETPTVASKPPAFVTAAAKRSNYRCPYGAFNKILFSGNNPDPKSDTPNADQIERNYFKSEQQNGTWNPFSLAVLKLGLTEPAYTSPLNYKKSPGTYKCANCGNPVFSSTAKYDSGSGWPSFWKTISSNRVSLKREWDGRIECSCANCGGHLGHVFPDGPTRGSLDKKELADVPETDPKIGYKVESPECDNGESEFSRMPRFCVNGVALRFEEK
ncbi:hypothetical protein ACHAXS_003684 [Conticribra weissflogii]